MLLSDNTRKLPGGISISGVVQTTPHYWVTLNGGGSEKLFDLIPSVIKYHCNLEW